MQNCSRDVLQVFKFSQDYQYTEALVQRCSVKKVLLEISQNSEKNTCARVSFLIKLQAEHLFWKNNSCGFFWIYFLQRLHVKFWNSISFNCFKIENYFTLCGTFCPWKLIISSLNLPNCEFWFKKTEIT